MLVGFPGNPLKFTLSNYIRTNMDAEQYCQQQAASSGSSFYYSFLFLQQNQRQAITAVYAFCRAVDDIVDDCTDISTAAATLGSSVQMPQATPSGHKPMAEAITMGATPSSRPPTAASS